MKPCEICRCTDNCGVIEFEDKIYSLTAERDDLKSRIATAEAIMVTLEKERDALKAQIEIYQDMMADLQLSVRNSVECSEERGMRLLKADAEISRLESEKKSMRGSKLLCPDCEMPCILVKRMDNQHYLKHPVYVCPKEIQEDLTKAEAEADRLRGELEKTQKVENIDGFYSCNHCGVGVQEHRGECPANDSRLFVEMVGSRDHWKALAMKAKEALEDIQRAGDKYRGEIGIAGDIAKAALAAYSEKGVS